MDAHASVGHAELEIPYNVHPRPDTGVYNAKLGIWLFLASEVMLFGALFSSLILLRTGADSWPRGYLMLNVPLATFNTFILILSSVTVVMAWSHLRLGNLKKGRIYISATILCALIFLVNKAFEYGHEFRETQLPEDEQLFRHLLHDDGIARSAHPRRRDRVSLFPRAGREDVGARSGALHEPDRDRRPLLAFRRSRLDFPFPGFCTSCRRSTT